MIEAVRICVFRVLPSLVMVTVMSLVPVATPVTVRVPAATVALLVLAEVNDVDSGVNAGASVYAKVTFSPTAMDAVVPESRELLVKVRLETLSGTSILQTSDDVVTVSLTVALPFADAVISPLEFVDAHVCPLTLVQLYVAPVMFEGLTVRDRAFSPAIKFVQPFTSIT